jgi:hypothetical protein
LTIYKGDRLELNIFENCFVTITSVEINNEKKSAKMILAQCVIVLAAVAVGLINCLRFPGLLLLPGFRLSKVKEKKIT